jgi:hypothetical protein
MVEGHVNKHFPCRKQVLLNYKRRKNLGVLKGQRDLIP